MSLVAWIVLGALSGLLFAGFYFRRSFAYVGGVILGAFGGFIGGFVFHVTAGKGVPQFNPWSLPAAFVGAVAVLVGFQVLRRAGHGD